MAAITREQAAELIRRSAGRFFSCTFVKANGDVREMRCRYAEVKKVGQHREHPDVITVHDDAIKNWRSIPLARLQQLRIDGEILEISP